MRQRFSKDQWVKWLTEFESSGLSVAAFCDQIQVSQNSFYLWRRKLNSERVGPEKSLVEVKLQKSDSIRIQLPGGAVAEVPNQLDSIRPLLQALSELDSAS